MADILGLNTVPPEGFQEEVEDTGAEPQAQIPVTPATEPPAGEPPKTEPPQADVFFDNFNKRYGTTYKADEELKALFDAPKKISEYEGKLKDFGTLQAEAEKRQKEIERLESLNDPLKFFSSPQTYVAEQLRIKYPDKDPVLLQEIATTDVDSMEDFDLLAKAEKLFNRKLPEGGRYVKDVLYKRYGLDPETKPEEWDGATKTQIAMDANVVKGRLNELKKGIELPKLVTKEEREKLQADSLAKKMQAIAPLRDQFLKYDKFQRGDLVFEPPAEYKAGLGDMFDGMFINADMEVNEENINFALKARDAWLLEANFDKIKEVIEKQAKTSLQAEIDAKLHNTQPPNQATASDQGGGEELPGLGKLADDLGRR
jgi:hypothetical protein